MRDEDVGAVPHLLKRYASQGGVVGVALPKCQTANAYLGHT